MTPDSLSAWLSPTALIFGILLGASMIIASVRSGWISRSIVWAAVVYGCVGAIMVLSPRWTTIALEYGEFKANIAKLEADKTKLETTVATLQSQIDEVSELSTLGNVSAKQALAQIDRTRKSVHWANFLPTNQNGYKIAVRPSNLSMMQNISSDLGIPSDEIAKILGSTDYTLLKNANETELSKLPPSSLWFNTSDK